VSRRELGQWQTPAELAHAALAIVSGLGVSPETVVEPTCGEGAFLAAAAQAFARARLVGYEIDRGFARAARARVSSSRSRVVVADFFDVDWDRELSAMREPILVTGNPPWVTSATLGVLGSDNLPDKSNFKGLTGFEALTGKSNFDISEWMILRLLQALRSRRSTLAVLCKSSVARRVVEFTAARGWSVRAGGLWRVDAMRHFGAAVDAVLFVCETGPSDRAGSRWPVHASLDAARPASTMAVVDGALVADVERYARTTFLAGDSDPEWRSGVKHDCARVMELTGRRGRWQNGLGERVAIEERMVFPLLKGSDVANGRDEPSRAVILPQRALGQETASLRRRAPKAWAYLSSHRDLLRSRKSAVYKGQADFAVFGVGPYCFAPWKVAISGLYKRCTFTLVGPRGPRPTLLDDTCYFLPFESGRAARRAWRGLQSAIAADFIQARVFWDAKRPISKAVLQKLDLRGLLDALDSPGGRASRRAGPCADRDSTRDPPRCILTRVLSERARKLLAEAASLPTEERAELASELYRSIVDDDTQVDAETARRIEDAIGVRSDRPATLPPADGSTGSSPPALVSSRLPGPRRA
jgi:hypothetical protein